MNAKRRIAITCAVLTGLAGILWVTTSGQRSASTFTYSQFLEQVRSGQVTSVVLFGSNSGAVEATCRLKDGKSMRTVLPSNYKEALRAMQDQLVNVEIRRSAIPVGLLVNAAPFLLLLSIWVILMIGKFPNFPGLPIR